MAEFTAPKTDWEIVQADKESIYLGNIYTVEFNLRLPDKGRYGSTITWESKNPDVITNEGKVTRPEIGQGNVIVTLVATVTKGDESDTREFEVTVLEREKRMVITDLLPVHVETKVGVEPRLPGVVITVSDDGTHSVTAVKWDEVDPAKYAVVGEFSIEGTAEHTEIKATAKVTVSETGYTLASPERPEKTVKDFALDEVKLLENSPFYENYKRAHDFLLSVNDDQQLYNFRTAAGLDTKGAPPMTGWDEPNGNLRGHTTGHYLSAIAYAYAGTKDERFKKKVDYMIAELAKCQDAMEASGKFNYGFLSGYSEEQFDKLEDFVPYPQIWAPYYTLHKIMAGLLDCYELAGNEQALEVVSKLGDWVYNRLSKLSKEHLNKMWAMYIAGEFGGINETMAKLYAVTGKETHLAAAQLFDNDKLFYPMSVNVDTLGGMHANQHAPQVIGALKIYEGNNDPYYYDIAENFWDMVVNSHIYNIGGTGAGEMFKPANVIAKFITEKTAETCVTYNMLKLTRQLFFRNPEARYMDYYERALCNHILASQDQSGPVGGSTYFMPLFPGMRKGYDTSGNSCCHGTGMENHIKYQESIYFQSVDGSTLYVNLYIPSELNWNAKGVKVTQSGDFLREQKSVFTIDGEGEFEIKFRVPCWIEKGFFVKVNGKEQDVEATAGSYVSLQRSWKSGDTIEVDIPFTFRLEGTPDDPKTVSIMYGPLVMVVKDSSHRYINLDVNSENIGEVIKATDDPLTFEIAGYTLIPNYAAWDCHYHAYFKVS